MSKMSNEQELFEKDKKIHALQRKIVDLEKFN